MTTEASPIPPQTEQVSCLERVFAFTDPAFKKYMTMSNAKRIGSRELMNLSSEMAQQEFPLIKYAGAWAAAEVAVRGTRRNFTPSSMRLHALDTAKKLWTEAGEGFGSLRRTSTSPEVKADLLAFELRTLQALAYAPSMQLTAELMGGENVDKQDMDLLLKQTREKVTMLGETVIDLGGSGEEFFRHRSGVVNEIFSGLILQKDKNPDFIIVPASLRQDNHSVERLRADLIAVEMQAPHKKTPIQITSNPGSKRYDPARFVIHAQSDLALKDGYRPRDSFRKYIERANGVSDPETDLKLNEMSQSLSDKLVDFNTRRAERSVYFRERN